LKKVFLLIIVLFTLLSCNKSEKETVAAVKPQPIVEQFGFKYNDFNVLHDTIRKGNTFGSIMESQNIGDNKVYDIVSKVKDTFDVRIMRIGKPFTILNLRIDIKTTSFIYQPDRGSYYVIDLRDSIVHVHKKLDLLPKKKEQ